MARFRVVFLFSLDTDFLTKPTVRSARDLSNARSRPIDVERSGHRAGSKNPSPERPNAVPGVAPQKVAGESRVHRVE